MNERDGAAVAAVRIGCNDPVCQDLVFFFKIVGDDPVDSLPALEALFHKNGFNTGALIPLDVQYDALSRVMIMNGHTAGNIHDSRRVASRSKRSVNFILRQAIPLAAVIGSFQKTAGLRHCLEFLRRDPVICTSGGRSAGADMYIIRVFTESAGKFMFAASARSYDSEHLWQPAAVILFSLHDLDKGKEFIVVIDAADA